MTADLKPYSSMKHASIRWLGDVPAHWAVQRLRNVAGTHFSNVDKHSTDGELPVQLCNYSDVYHNDRIRSDTDFMKATATSEEVERFHLVAGDVLITKDSEAWNDIGVPALVESANPDLICGYHLALLRPNVRRVSGAFLHRALSSRNIARQFFIRAKGVTRFGLSQIAIKSVWLPIPPLVEQAAIAHFLDHATCRIRRCIRAKEKLIALLEEQKAAIIHEAVTGQINVNTGQPYPAYKNTTVEWLASVPAHWEIRRSKRVFRPRKEWAKPDDIQLSATQAYGVIAQADYEKRVGRKVVRISRHLEKRRHVEVDDFVISMRSFQGGLERAWARGCIRSSYVVLRAVDELTVGYFELLLKSASYINALRSTANFIRDGQDLNFENFCGVDLPFPPLHEQRRIAEVVNTYVETTSELVAKTRHQMKVLGEYRARLIADVVTGKLDVREAAAMLPEDDLLSKEDEADGSLDTDNAPTFDQDNQPAGIAG